MGARARLEGPRVAVGAVEPQGVGGGVNYIEAVTI
jgi:hypothetical protein